MRAILLILIGLSSLLNSQNIPEFTKQNGVVTDSVTQLEWQDDYSDNGGDIKSTTWQSAIEYCEALTLNNQSDWRLPNINELSSLVDNSKYSPSINSVFELTSSGYYWSATTNTNNSNDAWFVYFSKGLVSYNYKNYSNYVRCVRAGE